MDDIIVVAEKELAQFARSMVQAMTLHKYKSVYWTDKHYRDNESTLRGK